MPVGEAEEGGDAGDVPGVLVAEAVLAQRREVGVADAARVAADLHREVEHGLLPRRDVGLAVVDRDLVGDQRLLLVDAQDRAVRDDAVEAAVGRRWWRR